MKRKNIADDKDTEADMLRKKRKIEGFSGEDDGCAYVPTFGDTEGEVIIDSGASHHMSHKEEHFRFVDYSRSVMLTVADKKMADPAYKARFKRSALGLGEGLFHPGLLSVLVSVSCLQDAGRWVVFAPTGVGNGESSEVIGTDGNTSVIKRGSDRLPKVELRFGGGDDDHEFELISNSHAGQGGDGRGFVLKASVFAAKASKREAALRDHLRHSHFHVDGVEITGCVQCDLAKGRTPGHK